MRSVILFFLIFSYLVSFSQAPSDSTRAKMPAIGKILGKVVDSTSGKPLDYASVALIRMKDTTAIGGTLTDSKGEFMLEEIPVGRYQIAITSIGYKNWKSALLMVNPKNPLINMGVIRVSSASKNLEEVVIQGEKQAFINAIDRKIYNVEKSIVNTGGTASEVLQQIPSVNVDIDGNISLRGSGNVTVLIDGRPSGLTGASRAAILQQIPASTIERIEVITNPSAKYDADGMAGIINIVTKKDKSAGFNGSTALSIGTRDKYNGNIGLNYRTRRINAFTNISYRHESRYGLGNSSRKNSIFYRNGSAIDTLYFNEQSNSGTSVNDAFVGKFGIDFYLNNYNTLGFSSTLSSRFGIDPGIIDYQDFDYAKNLMRDYGRISNSKDINNSVDGNIDYKKTFAGSSKELTANGTISYSTRDNVGEFEQTTQFNMSNIALPDVRQRTTGDGTFIVSTVQTDFSNPIHETGKFEAGFKTTYRRLGNNLKVDLYDYSSSTFNYDTLLSNHFIYNEVVPATYAQYMGKRDKLSYQLGLRAEFTYIEGQSISQSKTFYNRYISPFPSGFLKYEFRGQNELQIGYSRRINRPRYESLNPFVDYSDRLNLRTGNPYLKPEFVSSIDLSWFKLIKNHSINATLYHRYTTNLVTRYRTVDFNSGVSTITWQNFSSSINQGLELISKITLGKIGSITLSGNLFQNKINGGNIEADLQSSSINWNARMNSSLKLSPTTSMQLSGMYMAPFLIPQGTVSGMSGADIGIKQDLLKGLGSLSFNLSDIFDTRRFRSVQEGEYFVVTGNRKRETRIAYLTFSYRFGKQQEQGQRNTKRNQRQEGDSAPPMDF